MTSLPKRDVDEKNELKVISINGRVSNIIGT